jgi:arginase
MAAAAGGELPFPEVATVAEETLAAQNLELAAALPARPLVAGGCCCAHVGAVEGLAARGSRVAVVWLDAHGDLNTSEASPSGNEWGMPLRMLVDGGTVRVEDVVLVGARRLDPGEEAFLDQAGLALGIDGVVPALASADAVYVAIDCDVLDPGEGVDVFMPEPDGLSIASVELVIERATELRPLAGAGFTGLVAAPGNQPVLERLCRALGL